MTNSARHKKLLSRISFIEKNLLPEIRTSGNYSKKETDLIRSYVLLAHAEIEAYFEEIATEKARKSLTYWIDGKKSSNCVISIMSFCGGELNWENKEDKVKIQSRVNKTIMHYINSLKKNNGIKSSNIKDILLPLGIDCNDLDQTWLNVMDDFGKLRGSFAHTTHSVQSQIDLKTEKDRINEQILPEISRLDILIKDIK